MSEPTPKPLAANLRKAFALQCLLAGHEVLGLAPAWHRGNVEKHNQPELEF